MRSSNTASGNDSLTIRHKRSQSRHTEGVKQCRLVCETVLSAVTNPIVMLYIGQVTVRHVIPLYL